MRKAGKTNQSNRDEWIEKTLKGLPDGLRLLDAGCGTQPYRKWCAHLDYVGQDFGGYDGSGDSKAIHPDGFSYGDLDIVSDVTEIPEPDESFDVILCSEVIEHIPEPSRAISEFSRLLKKNGKLILTAPFCSITHYSPYHFCTGFNRYWYQHHLEKNGFHIVDCLANGNFFEYVAQEVNRINSVARTYSKGGGLGAMEKIARKILVNALARLSDSGDSSSELLCHGYHVFAEKT